MNTIKKAAYLCTAFLIISSFFSCNNKNETELSSSDKQTSSIAQTDKTISKEKSSPKIETFYDARYLKGTQDFSNISSIKYSGDKLYILGTRYYERNTSLLSTDLDTLVISQTESDKSIPEDFEECNSYRDSKGNIYNCLTYGIEKYNSRKKCLDFFISKEDLYINNDLKYLESICSTAVSENGDMYFAASIKDKDNLFIIKLNSSSEIQYIAESQDIPSNKYSIIKFYIGENGNPVLCTQSDCIYINEISADTGSTVSRYNIPAADEIMGGYKNYNVIYRIGNSIYGYDWSDDNTAQLYQADNSNYEITKAYIRNNSVITEQLEKDKHDNLLAIYDKDGEEEKKVVIPGIIKTDNISITPDGTVFILNRHYTVDYSKENETNEENANNSDNRYKVACPDDCGGYETTQPEILCLGKDGTVSTIYKGEQEHPALRHKFAADSKGNLLICYSSRSDDYTVHATYIRSTGEQIQMTYGASGDVKDVVCLNDQFLIEFDSYKNRDSSLLLLPVDNETYTINNPLDIKLPSDDLIEGSEGFDFYYQSDNVIYGFKIADNSSEKVFSWFDSDVSFIPDWKQYVVIADSENIFFADNGFNYNMFSDIPSTTKNISAMHLKKYDETQLKEINNRNIITLEGMNIDNSLFSKIQKFNKNFKDYLIIATDYSQNDLEISVDSLSDPTGSSKLRTDNTHGNIPDIILGDCSFDINSLLKNNTLADLNDTLRNDPDIDSSDLAENILDTCTYNGKLYAIPYSFNLTTLLVPDKCIENKDMLTYDEFFSLADKYGDRLSSDCTRKQISDLIFSSYINDNIDLEKSTCNFETDIFKSILEKTKKCFPENLDYSIINNDEIINGYLFSINNINESFSLSNKLTGMKNMGNESVLYSIKGIPSSSDTTALININTYLCIPDFSDNKEGAWKFIKYLINYSNERPEVSLDCLSILLSKNKQYINKSIPILTDTTSPGLSKPYKETLTADLNTLCNGKLININNFSDINKIIYEQADKYYNDKQSVDETISAVQSKVKLYLSQLD